MQALLVSDATEYKAAASAHHQKQDTGRVMNES